MKRGTGRALLLGTVAGFCLSVRILAADAGTKAVDAAWEKAFRAADLEGVVACYAPDAVLWLPNAPEARGTKAIREAYSGFFSTYTIDGVALRKTSYETRDSVSVGWGEFEMRLTPRAGGEPTVMVGRFTALARPLGDRWVYVVDHASVGPAPQPAARP